MSDPTPPPDLSKVPLIQGTDTRALARELASLTTQIAELAARVAALEAARS